MNFAFQVYGVVLPSKTGALGRDLQTQRHPCSLPPSSLGPSTCAYPAEHTYSPYSSTILNCWQRRTQGGDGCVGESWKEISGPPTATIPPPL